MKKMLVWITAVAMLLTLFVAQPVSAQEEDQEQDTSTQTTTQPQNTGTIYDVIRTDPRLESFQLLVEAAGLSDNLDQDGPFTVFAPTNEALARLNNVVRNTDATPTDILLYHVVNGRYHSQALANQGALPTLEGNRLFFDGVTRATMLNEVAGLVEGDIQAANGVVHIVDAVVPLPAAHTIFASDAGTASNTMWQVLQNDGRFNTFLSLAQQAGLADELQNRGVRYTLFAPTDEAFANVSDDLMARWEADPHGELHTILSYHLVTDRLSINQIATDDYLPTMEGRMMRVTTDEDVQVYVNGRAVEAFNVVSANGVIHVVDEVVLP